MSQIGRRAASSNPVEDAGQFRRIEPDAVRLAILDHDAAAAPPLAESVVSAVHKTAANRAGTVAGASRREIGLDEFDPFSRSEQRRCGFLLRLSDKVLEDLDTKPQTGTGVALERSMTANAQSSRVKRRFIPAGRAAEIADRADRLFGRDQMSAGMAVAGAIADVRQAMRTDGKQVAFVKREVRSAVLARAARPAACGTAGGTADDARIVATGLLYADNLPALAAKSCSDLVLACPVLPAACWASHKKPHGRIPG